MTRENPYTNPKDDRQAAIEMNEFSKTVFAKVYPLIAQQVVDMFYITKGTCIDLGSGPGFLSIALACLTDLKIYALDQSRHSFEIAADNIARQGLEQQVVPVLADIRDMPFEDNSTDLIVSRGSVFFWPDLVKAFEEIFRVLKPGGKTYIGGGFGSAKLKKEIFSLMAKKDKSFEKNVKKRQSPEKLEKIKSALDVSSISGYEMIRSQEGFWITIEKEKKTISQL